MFNILRGLVAGLIATALVTMLIVIKNMIGITPELNTMPLMTDAVQRSNPFLVSPTIGWAIHFLIFTIVWSFIFALLAGKGSSYSPRSFSMVYSLFAWLIMMMVTMPLAGNGYFALQESLAAPLVALVLHLAWGWVVGFVYDLLPSAS